MLVFLTIATLSFASLALQNTVNQDYLTLNLYESTNARSLICECELNPIQFTTDPKTYQNIFRPPQSNSLTRLLLKSRLLKLVNLKDNTPLAQSQIKSESIQIMRKNAYDILPYFHTKIEIDTQTLLRSHEEQKFSCCIERSRWNKRALTKPLLCSFITLNRTTTDSNNVSKEIRKSQLNSTLSAHLLAIMMTRQIFFVFTFFIIVIIIIALFYKLAWSKKAKDTNDGGDVSQDDRDYFQSPDFIKSSPCFYTISDDYNDKRIISLTQKQLRSLHQNASFKNPKRLDFANNQTDSLDSLESPESAAAAPPTYQAYLDSKDQKY
jgi:preprotein translocase subunit SecG